MNARYLVGDVFDRLAELEDGSVDLVLTSPPFLALRSYLPADHPDKAKEIGAEPTPAAFLDTLLALTAEWRRVLAPHGSIAVELGDTYAGSGGPSGDSRGIGLMSGSRGGAMPAAVNHVGDGWPLVKSLCGIPHLYHLSLAYGRNLLTGEPSPAGTWRVRNVIAWCRPNPPVGALGDKFRPATSYMTIATVARDRYFDLDAVRVPADPANIRDGSPLNTAASKGHRSGQRTISRSSEDWKGTAPPLDWWEIPTQPYKGSHYATWPMALCERPIKAMCPQRVCTVCGEPSRRITSVDYTAAGGTGGRFDDGIDARGYRQRTAERMTKQVDTLGWSDCGHDDYRNGLVLDPFAGSGTTLAVATGHGRDAIGIDLDPRNVALASDRVGMFLEVEYPDEARAEANRSDDPLLAEGREGAA